MSLALFRWILILRYWVTLNKQKVLLTIAMFLFAYVAGTVFFIFKEVYFNGEFSTLHPHFSKIPPYGELVASGAILGVALYLFIKSMRSCLND